MLHLSAKRSLNHKHIKLFKLFGQVTNIWNWSTHIFFPNSFPCDAESEKCGEMCLQIVNFHSTERTHVRAEKIILAVIFTRDRIDIFVSFIRTGTEWCFSYQKRGNFYYLSKVEKILHYIGDLMSDVIDRKWFMWMRVIQLEVRKCENSDHTI